MIFQRWFLLPGYVRGSFLAYYLAAARVESKDYDGIAEALRPVYAGEAASPFTGRGWILQARAARDNAPTARTMSSTHAI